MPVFSRYGLTNAAVWVGASITPSRNSFTVGADSSPPTYGSRMASSESSTVAGSSSSSAETVSAYCARAVSRPASRSDAAAASELSSELAFMYDVMPRRFILRIAARSERAFCSTVGSGMWLPTSPTAESSRSPVGSPLASRMIVPSGGSGVAAVTPAISSAREFASAVCPSSECTRMGRAVSRTSRSAFVGTVPGGWMSW